MWAEAIKYFTVLFFSMFKFIAGPVAGKGFGLPIWITIFLTAAGMMATVIVFIFGGKRFIQWVKQKLTRKKKVFSPRTRRFVSIWKKYGIQGVSFLTPLILTPVGGALIVAAYGADRRKVLLYMSVSAFFWSAVLTHGVYFLTGIFL